MYLGDDNFTGTIPFTWGTGSDNAGGDGFVIPSSDQSSGQSSGADYQAVQGNVGNSTDTGGMDWSSIVGGIGTAFSKFLAPLTGGGTPPPGGALPPGQSPPSTGQPPSQLTATIGPDGASLTTGQPSSSGMLANLTNFQTPYPYLAMGGALLLIVLATGGKGAK